MPICSPPNFFCAWLAVNFNRNLSEFNDCVLLTGNSQAKILIKNKDSQVKGLNGETTVLQNRVHPSRQLEKFFELLGTRELQILCSAFLAVGIDALPSCMISSLISYLISSLISYKNVCVTL